MQTVDEIAEYEFDLPEAQIALYPPEQRGDSLLLVDDGNKFADTRFSAIADYFVPGDVLLLNDSRVFAARTYMTRATGGKIELLFVAPVEDTRWRVFGQTKRLRAGEFLTPASGADILGNACEVVQVENDYALLETGVSTAATRRWLEDHGTLALPPYIVRRREKAQWEGDADRYQTTYSSEVGSIAAPTASLHWTTQLLQQLRDKGVEILTLTHHVGPGTFKPVRSNTLAEHSVDPEWTSLSYETAQALRKAREQHRRITVGGTTACRAVEAVALKSDMRESYCGLVNLTIKPGFRFQYTDRLITNFHLPRSSLLLLVAALVGPRWKDAYQHAIRMGYKFYSYGDASLLESCNATPPANT